MPDIFEYSDYRKYLADYFAEQKAKNSAFSYQLFSNKCGFKNKGFIYNVMCGRKNLSKSSIVGVCEALKLTRAETDFFENLVSLNQAPNFKSKNYYFEKLNGFRTTNPKASQAKKLREDQYGFYATWYHCAIRSLIDMHPFKNDYSWLAKNVMPPITPKKAQKSVELLERLGLIQKQKNGYYKVTEKSITTGKEISGLAIGKFHLEAMQLAAKALKELPKEKRHITGLTLGISKEAYEKICDEIFEFHDKIMKIADEDKSANSVYQMNFHFFPFSNTEIERSVK